EQRHKTDPTSHTLQLLQNTRINIRQLLIDDTARALTWRKRTYYNKSNKMDTLLARTLRPRTQHPHITKIRAPDGTLKTSPTEIAQTFSTFYTTLYNHSPQDDTTITAANQKITDFLTQLNLPKLHTAAITELA
ncbi:Hypothetical predicted protein, partial [Pelobates cultripes]